MDWDDGAGEEWVRISLNEYGTVYMINIRIGIIFARKSYQKQIPEKFYSVYEIVFVDTYNDDEWYLDTAELKASYLYCRKI